MRNYFLFKSFSQFLINKESYEVNIANIQKNIGKDNL